MRCTPVRCTTMRYTHVNARLSLRSLEKCILAPKSLGATSLPVRLFEMKELMSILVTIYLLGMLFLPVSLYCWKTSRRNPISGNRKEMLRSKGEGAAELPAFGIGPIRLCQNPGVPLEQCICCRKSKEKCDGQRPKCGGWRTWRRCPIGIARVLSLTRTYEGQNGSMPP
jgi:hypothetical protein